MVANAFVMCTPAFAFGGRAVTVFRTIGEPPVCPGVFVGLLPEGLLVGWVTNGGKVGFFTTGLAVALTSTASFFSSGVAKELPVFSRTIAFF